MGIQDDRPSQLSGTGAGKTTLVVMAAGMGSRFGGIKQLESAGPGGETILEYSLFDAQRAGFSEVVFIIRKTMEADFRSMLLDKISTDLSVRLAYQETGFLPESWAAAMQNRDPMALGYADMDGSVPDRIVRNRMKPWGTGHAIWCARDSIDSPFAVINADDYYGPASFAIMHDFLAGVPPESDSYAMVAFELGKTLSQHGAVARGICGVDKAGFLTDIVEHTKLEAIKEEHRAGHSASTGSHIASIEGSIESIHADGARSYHPVDAPVSMNLFGFTPRFLGRLETLLVDFLANSSQDPEAEFYLPGAVQHLVKAGDATVRILRSPETWFGLTYREDMDAVRSKLRQRVGAGVYPPSLRASR
jgi:hypothetical protein